MRTDHHCRLAANRQCCRKHHCQLATNWQWWHCWLEPQPSSIGLAITAGSCHKQAVIRTIALRFKHKPIVLLEMNSTGWSYEPTVLVEMNTVSCVKNRQ